MMLSPRDARPISRSERFSSITTLISQRSENGASASVKPRLARISTASPDHTSLSRSSSTGTGASDSGPRGSLIRTTLCSALTAVSRPAVPSLNSSTTGPVLVKRIRCRHRSRTARAHIPEFCAQVDRDAADGNLSPTVPRNSLGSSSIPWYRPATIKASSRGWIGGSSATARWIGETVFAPPPASATERGPCPEEPEMLPSFTSTSSPPQRLIQPARSPYASPRRTIPGTSPGQLLPAVDRPTWVVNRRNIRWDNRPFQSTIHQQISDWAC